MFSKSSRENIETRFDPGIEVMMDLVKRQRMQARLPTVEAVKKAMLQYTNYMQQIKSKKIPDTHAILLLESCRYLGTGQQQDAGDHSHTPAKSKGGDPVFGAIGALLWNLQEYVNEAHVKLARYVYDTSTQGRILRVNELKGLVRMLCSCGRPNEALDVLEKAQDLDHSHLASTHTSSLDFTRCVTAIMCELAERNMADEISRALRMSQRFDRSKKLVTASLMVVFYVRCQDIANTKVWFEEMIAETKVGVIDPYEARFVAAALRETLYLCWQTRHLDLGHGFVRAIMERGNPLKIFWDEILTWGFLLQRSIDEVNRMMDVMVKSNKEIKDRAHWRLPDIGTINRLVRTAIAEKDAYTAERLISLGKQRGFEPNVPTLCLQMEYRLDNHDIDGALDAYKLLQSKDTSTQKDVPMVNRLIVALCNSGRHDYETIMNVAADLTDRRAAFGAQTVQALAVIHLKRDELQDFQDLIKTHAHHFSSDDRTNLRAAIKDFCLAGTTPTASMWDAYQILREDFDEMPREERTEIMQNCFDRKRPDMAVHVFNHMRAHSRQDTMPDASTYVAAFLGAGQVKDFKILRALHNQLKLETVVDPTTRARNALMIAFIACEHGDEALDIWDDILLSREGPNYNSILIALRACEKTHFMDSKAVRIWARLRRNNIELDQTMWASYIAALVGNGNVEQAVTTLEEAYRKNEVELDPLLLGSLYNAAIWTGKQHQIAAWASAEHSKAWARLQEVGMDTNEYRAKSYQVDRSLRP